MSTNNDWDRSTEESLRSGGLALLRPQTQVLDDDWMGRTLETILTEAAPERTRPRRWHTLVIGASVVVAATGGVAAATGVVPGFVESRMSWLQREAPESPQATAPAVSLIADVALPGDGRFAAWRGIGQGEQCNAQVDNWDGGERFAGGGMGCGEIDPESADRDLQLFTLRFSPDAKRDWFYPVVYGAPDDRPQDASVTRVRVHAQLYDGPDWRRDVTLDPATRGFGVVVPGARPRSSMELEWDTASSETSPRDSNLSSLVIDLLDDQDRIVRSITLFSAEKEAGSAIP